MNPPDPVILFTVDVEDWFQVENFKDCIPFSSWDSCELRVERNVHRLLDLFEDINYQPSSVSSEPGCERNSKATFFILGWLGERFPNLVREIHARGHEVASHGYNHCLCNECSLEELRQDLTDSRKKLEDLIGAPVLGYRAPSFSISHDILKVIRDCGYLYDSSYNSFGLHGRYGKVDFSGNGKKGIALEISKGFFELPISNLQITNMIFPWGGGGYFRLIPFSIFTIGVESILRKDHAYVFYCHPWEIDPGQPKVKNAPKSHKFRHYVNLDKSISKLSKFILNYRKHNFITCRQYIDELR